VFSVANEDVWVNGKSVEIDACTSPPQYQTRRHSVERKPPPRHIEIDTVSLPATSSGVDFYTLSCY